MPISACFSEAQDDLLPQTLHPPEENLAEMPASSSDSPQPAPLFLSHIKPTSQLRLITLFFTFFRLLIPGWVQLEAINRVSIVVQSL